MVVQSTPDVGTMCLRHLDQACSVTAPPYAEAVDGAADSEQPRPHLVALCRPLLDDGMQFCHRSVARFGEQVQASEDLADLECLA